MSDAKSETPSPPTPGVSPKPRGKLLRYLAVAGGALLALIVVLYFVATSSGFITGVVMPRVGKAIGAEVSVGRVALSPFSSLEVKDLKVKTIGDELLLELASLKATYSLRDIIGGRITVNSVEVDSPTVRLIQQADGKSNLDPILEAVASKEPKPKSTTKTLLNIGPVSVRNVNFQFTSHQKGGGQMKAAAKGLNLSVDGVKNNQPLKASLDGGIDFSQTGPKQDDALAATLKGSVQTELNDDLMPKSLQSDIALAVSNARGSFADAAQLATTVKADLSLTEIKQLAVNFARGGTALGQVTVSGPLDAMKQEGRLRIGVTGIGNEVLSLAGAKYGIYFGSTKLAANYDVELKNQAKTINTTGTLTGEKFSLRRGELATPTLDFQLNYNVALDLPKSNAVIRAFSFAVTQSGRPLLAASLSKEMPIDWGKGGEALDESALVLTVNQLNLADWRTFLGTNVTAGSVSGKLNLTARKAGKDITLDVDTQLTGLAANFQSNRIERADAQLSAKGQVTDLSRVALSEFGLRVAQAAQPVIALTGSGSLDSARMDAQFQAEVDANLAAAGRLLNRPDLTVSSGTLKFSGKVAQKNQTTDPKAKPQFDQSVAGKVRLENLTARFAGNKFERFELVTDVDLDMKNQVATVNQARGTLRQAGEAGGSFEVNGRVDTAKLAGQVEFKLTDLNQNTLRSFVAAALGENQLKSVSIGANARAVFDPQTGSSVNGDFQVANLLLVDPAGQLPKDPLSVKVDLDAGSPKAGLYEIKKFGGDVRLGELNAGSFGVAGQVNLGQAKPKGQIALQLTDLNQNALRPFLATALGKARLESVSINAKADATFDLQASSSVKGDFKVANLLVTDPEGRFPKDPMNLGLILDAASPKMGLYQINKLGGAVQVGALNGGAFDVTGSVQVGQALEQGQFTLKLTDLNQNLLRPFLVSALGETKLASVSINATANASYDPKGQTTVKADAQVANLLLTNPKANLPKDPLTIGLAVDGGMAKQIVDLRQLQLKLSPTQRARNELNLTGRVDLSKTNAIAGDLKLVADSLDVTPYYDLLAAPKGQPAGPAASGGAKPASPPPPAPPAPEQEPPAMKLPIQNFTAEVNIGKLYLGEIALSNLVVNTKLDATTVAVDPFKLTFNGAPVSARVNANLGVPGYQYDVRANVDRLPIGPIVDTFAPEMAGKAKGALLLDTQIKGAGVTGENLRRSLAGNVGLSLTNATIILPDPKEVLTGPIGGTIRIILAIIGPIAPVLNVSVDDLLKPPISFIDTKVNLGSGQIDLQRFLVASEAFRANAAGTVTIAKVLTNSPINDIPVDIALSTPLAKKARLAKADADSSGYTQLPNFVTLGGSIGEPKPEIDKLVISGLLLKSVSGVPGMIGGKAGGILKGVGGLLTGEAPEKSSSTNAPATNQPAIKINPFDLFKRKN